MIAIRTVLAAVIFGAGLTSFSIAATAMGDKPAKEDTAAEQDVPPPPPPQKPTAAPTKGPATAATAGNTYTWNDGTRTHTVWLNPNTLAEFNVAADDKATPVKRALPAAQSFKSAGGARLWRLTDGTAPTTAIRDTLAKQPNAKISLVFSDNASGTGRMRALPGNVIVYLPADWNDAAAHTWAQKQGVLIDRKLDIGKNAYVVRTAPGLAALETANRLHQTGEVVRAIPDWWQETSTR